MRIGAGRAQWGPPAAVAPVMVVSTGGVPVVCPTCGWPTAVQPRRHQRLFPPRPGQVRAEGPRKNCAARGGSSSPHSINFRFDIHYYHIDTHTHIHTLDGDLDGFPLLFPVGGGWGGRGSWILNFGRIYAGFDF